MARLLGGSPELLPLAETRAVHRSGLRFVLAFWLALLLVAGYPLVIRASNPRAATDLGVWLSTAVCVVAGLRLAYLSLDGSMRVLSLSFWVFVYVWLGASPLAQFGLGLFPHRGNYTRAELLTGFTMVAVGLACYEAGKRLPYRLLPASRLLAATGARVVSVHRVLVFGSVAVATTLALAYLAGGTELFFSPQTRVVETIRGTVGAGHSERLHLLSRAIQVPPYLGLYLAAWLLVRHKAARVSPRLRRALYCLCAVLIVLNLLVNNPVNSSRYWFGNIALSLGLVVLPWSRRWSFAAWTVALTLAMLLLFPYADLFRHEVDLRQFEFRGLEPVAVKADYDAFQQLLNAVPFVEEHGWGLGRQFAGTLLFWVPRAWWPDKPLPSGNLVAEYSSYQFTNLAMPLWGEAYLDGGLWAVALLFLFYGRLSESLERAHAREGKRASSLFHLLLPMVAGYQIFLLRGALMVAVAYLTPMLLGLWIVTRSEATGIGEDHGTA